MKKVKLPVEFRKNGAIERSFLSFKSRRKLLKWHRANWQSVILNRQDNKRVFLVGNMSYTL